MSLRATFFILSPKIYLYLVAKKEYHDADLLAPTH